MWVQGRACLPAACVASRVWVRAQAQGVPASAAGHPQVPHGGISLPPHVRPGRKRVRDIRCESHNPFFESQ